MEEFAKVTGKCRCYRDVYMFETEMSVSQISSNNIMKFMDGKAGSS